jgi:GTPase SAR1 family protein
VAEFLDSFDVERAALLAAVDRFEEVWGRFQSRRGLELDPERATDSLLALEVAEIRRELMATEFTIGIFGLIKRGKSTLLNALIGREVSSMHVTPETAVPVYVSYGDTPEATVHFADGTSRCVAVDEVHRFTSQKANAGNHLGVTFVEQQVPVGFLRNGTRLIDTPGMDDAEADEVYTERTLQELDVVDAGVVLFLSPPTVGATELAFLEEVVGRDLRKTFLVCNLYPQHFHDPMTRLAVLEYVGKRVAEASARANRSGEIRIYPVCALEAWTARQDHDVDLWKRSGADRLLRDIENYLGDHAGQQVLDDAAQRVVRATELAKAEVQVRQHLLDDPEDLQRLRTQLDRDILDLERRFEEAVALALTEVGPLEVRIRGLVLQPFLRARTQLPELTTLDELDAFASRFRRELEVAGELASRQFGAGFARLVGALEALLAERFHAVMNDLAPDAPQVRLSSDAHLVTPDQMQLLLAAQRRSQQTSRTGALAGGLAGGGAAIAAAGAVLGPIGLLGGALVGWKLASAVTGQRNLELARATVAARLDEVAATLLADIDGQVAGTVAALRSAVEQRRRSFAHDLYQQFDVVRSIGDDPRALDAYRRDASRFFEAFDDCADHARRAVGRTSMQPALSPYAASVAPPPA